MQLLVELAGFPIQLDRNLHQVENGAGFFM